jgi:pSer/pThr/pTyr-binding forkhead associated (FHA) protein
MQLRYLNVEGKTATLRLATEPVLIGREPGVQIVLHDAKASRNHCEIRVWDGDYVIKDLRSRNGTLVNNKPVEVAVLQPGDEIQIGDAVIFFEEKAPLGSSTALRQIEERMDEGKGYNTILKEIVRESGKDKKDRKDK